MNRRQQKWHQSLLLNWTSALMHSACCRAICTQVGKAEDKKLFSLKWPSDEQVFQHFLPASGSIWDWAQKSNGTIYVNRLVAGEGKLKLESWIGWAVQERYLPAYCNTAKILSVLLRHSMSPAGSSGFVSLPPWGMVMSCPCCTYMSLALKIPGERE